MRLNESPWPVKENAMNAKKTSTAVNTLLCLIFFMAMTAACDNDHGMMQGNRNMGINNGSWMQILTILGVVCLAGLLLWFTISRRRR
jgi:hypothetical protein